MSRYTLQPGMIVPQTPFYYCDIDLLQRTLQTATTEAARYGYQIHYAMKANAEPHILYEIQQAGLGADCVSGYEVECAIENGFHPSKIVFAGVGKSDREIEYAIRQGIFAFNCESLQELEVINELAGRLGKQVNVALRINPDVRPHTHHYISTGQSESKFGISYAEIDAALAELHAMKNMGGGLGIDYNDPDGEPIPDFVGYFRTFHENLRLTPGQTVHFELGRSIVAQCGELITRVLYTKTTAGGAHFVITDAGMTELIRPALYSARHKIENLTAAAERRPIGLCSIAGPICESSDIFARDIEFPESHRGDILSIRSTGAYGSIMASHYNMRPTAPSRFSDGTIWGQSNLAEL